MAICGPTGVGKTALSLALSERVHAEIVGMDSVQIYKELDIGSAKASRAERERVPHHLIDVMEVEHEHNVGMYRDRAHQVVDEIHTRGKRALFVGGTGLYLRVTIHGLLDAPPPDREIRARHKEIVKRLGAPSLYEELSRIDPDLAERLHPNDAVRVSRGLEVWEQTGRTMSALQREHQFRLPHYHALKIALIRPRAELHDRIARRVTSMMERGLIEEVEAIVGRHGDGAQVLKSLGYAQVVAHLRGEISQEQAIAQITQQTRRYAKQQISWLRSEPGVIWARAPVIEEGEVPQPLVEDINHFFESGQIPDVPSWGGADAYM